MQKLQLFVATARPEQWLKNTVLFAALIFSLHAFVFLDFLRVFGGFLLFCGISSAVYCLNDIFDRNADQQHPVKSARPIAAGLITLHEALLWFSFLSVVSVVAGFILQREFGLILLVYLIVQLLYSWFLKHIVLVDIFIIAAGFVLRTIAGAIIIHVTLSHWLVIATVLLALFLGFGKRRYELAAVPTESQRVRPVLADYGEPFLDQMIAVITSATLIVYILYVTSGETITKFHTDKMIWTVPFVLYGIFRYLYLIYQKNGGGNPARVFFTDRPLLLDIALWAIAIMVILYGRIFSNV